MIMIMMLSDRGSNLVLLGLVENKVAFELQPGEDDLRG
jgi:hypothetical protein